MSSRKKIWIVAAAAAAIVWGGLLAPPALADGVLAPPTASPAGTFNGIDYVQYDGLFAGRTSTGDYRVPYRITAPVDPRRNNGTAIVEPPHQAGGTGTLDTFLGRSFLLGRGFIHTSVGYSTTTFGQGRLRILDPERKVSACGGKGVFICGGFRDHNGRTDDEIIVDFARALVDDPQAHVLAGLVARRYLTGFSDSSAPVVRLVASGQADGAFDLAFPFTASPTDLEAAHLPTDLQAALLDGRYAGKLMIVNSEDEGPTADFVDRGVAQGRYRFYSVPGTPHVPDLFVPFFWSMTTPASFQPELRGHFLQADRWAKQNMQPAPSTHLLTANDGTLARDANGNAVSVDPAGTPVPRLPFIELGEAHYITGFVGSYDNVKTVTELGFSSHDEYLKAFDNRLAAYVRAFDIPKEDANEMRSRAALCPEKTFTETYRDHYDEFVAIRPCTT